MCYLVFFRETELIESFYKYKNEIYQLFQQWLSYNGKFKAPLAIQFVGLDPKEVGSNARKEQACQYEWGQSR